jgi:hypothetical protein
MFRLGLAVAVTAASTPLNALPTSASADSVRTRPAVAIPHENDARSVLRSILTHKIEASDAFIVSIGGRRTSKFMGGNKNSQFIYDFTTSPPLSMILDLNNGLYFIEVRNQEYSASSNRSEPMRCLYYMNDDFMSSTGWKKKSSYNMGIVGGAIYTKGRYILRSNFGSLGCFGSASVKLNTNKGF